MGGGGDSKWLHIYHCGFCMKVICGFITLEKLLIFKNDDIFNIINQMKVYDTDTDLMEALLKLHLHLFLIRIASKFLSVAAVH